MTAKSSCDELALLGGQPLFAQPRSTSSLVQPDFERFLEYSRTFYEAHQFTNNGPLVQQLEQGSVELDSGGRHRGLVG